MPFRGRVPWLNGPTGEIPNGAVVDTREGLRIKVSPDGMYRAVYFWGDYEPYNTKIYKRIVRPGDVVFDIGANFGWFTALFARWVGTEGEVHAFEPIPFIHEFAVETLALNGVKAHLNRVALGRQEGILLMHTYTGLPHGHATAVGLNRDDAVPHLVGLMRLDRYCEDHSIEAVQFMKVDVDGFELDVFAGAERLLSLPDAPVIGFELDEECLQARSLGSGDVIAELRRFGYSHFYRFSTRTGVRMIESDDFISSDCLAFKTSHREDVASALRANRLFR